MQNYTLHASKKNVMRNKVKLDFYFGKLGSIPSESSNKILLLLKEAYSAPCQTSKIDSLFCIKLQT